jgi:hypothetical protein
MIRLTLSLEVDGKSKMIQVDSLTHGDFVTGPAHIMSQYLEPMSEILFDAYRDLTSETVRSAMEAAEERQSISKRLAQLGMV